MSIGNEPSSAEFVALINKRNEYLKAFSGEEDKAVYPKLEKLYFKLPSYYYEHGSAVLNTPMYLRKPVSPATAGAIGSAIGGTAVGVAAVLDAIEEEEKYRQTAQRVDQARYSERVAYRRLYECYVGIVAIIRTKETTRKDWENQCRLIREKEERRIEAQRREEEEKERKRSDSVMRFIFIIMALASIYMIFGIGGDAKVLAICGILSSFSIFVGFKVTSRVNFVLGFCVGFLLVVLSLIGCILFFP